jgi:3-oxoacyl-[acyl-carrier-protein] synthase-1
MQVARKMILRGEYEHVVVVGADVISRFIVSGFQSFHSLSPEPCSPFDRHRDGLSLGEAASTVVLSSVRGDVELLSAASSNDANHISGPSRTGEGLFLAMRPALEGQPVPGLISAHGTATVYNDEMESLAIQQAGLQHVPVNSLKGFFGHTLGAAGIVETLANLEAMKQSVLLPTRGFREMGVSGDIRVLAEPMNTGSKVLLKLASGFGGCNAAALFRIRT